MLTMMLNGCDAISEEETRRFQTRESIGTCPVCGSLVYESKTNFYCSNHDCHFALWKDNRYLQSMEKTMDKKMAAELLKNGSVHVKDLYSRKKNMYFEADLHMDTDETGKVNFSLSFPKKKPKNKSKEDLAITYHVAVGKDQDGLSSMFIKNDLLEQYGISAEQLHEDAMKSSPHVMIPEVSSIGALIDEMYQKNILMLTPDEREMLQETLQESSEMPTFFVVTNTDRIDGAGVIFYPEFMDSMGELLGNDFFILPSSIHEMLVLPDDGQVDAEMLRDMVKEVNATQVAPAERLTNDVYHFDTKDHVFEKADRFTERQKEKEAQAAKTEKAGKEQPDQKPKTKKHDMEL